MVAEWYASFSLKARQRQVVWEVGAVFSEDEASLSGSKANPQGS